MKVPLNWLKEFVSLPKNEKLLTDKLTMVGHMLDKKLEVDGQTVLDLELRGNRADCYSIYGIAREVSAIFGTKLKKPQLLELKKVNKFKSSTLNIKTPLVKRAAMTEVYNVKIIKSPKWLTQRLAEYGMESVNNIVDLTNYVMIETGEPMHAFDLDKVKGELEIRLAKKNEKIVTFQDSTLNLTNEDLVWAQNKEVLSVAGAIGEKFHSISVVTTNILVEAANYDRANIRKSVYRHNLLTEAGIRHEKELDVNMVDIALGRFLYLLNKNDWGRSDGKVYDYYPNKISPWKVTLNFSYLEELAGVNLEPSLIKKILIDLNFEILKIDKASLTVLVPTFRTDVNLPEDLAEEILRIYGYEKIPTKVLSLEIPKDVTPDYIKQENSLRDSAVSVGFNEAITLSFVKVDLSRLNVDPEKSLNVPATLINPPSPDNKTLRINLLPNLFELSKKALNERAEEIRFFEIGKVYFKEKGKYYEKRKIGFIYYNTTNNSFAEFKSMLNTFFVKDGFGLPNYILEAYLLPIRQSFKINFGNKAIGFGGIYDNVFYTELDLDGLLDFGSKYSVNLWPKYPPQIEDLTFILPEKTYIGEVVNSVKSVSQLVNKIELKDTFKDAYTFRIWYQDLNKTLTDKEVEEIRNKILKTVKEKFGGQIKN